jgi:hypothetical protein
MSCRLSTADPPGEGGGTCAAEIVRILAAGDAGDEDVVAGAGTFRNRRMASAK